MTNQTSTCHACNGTRIDADFGTPCTECDRDASLAQQRFNAPTGPADRMHTPGERLDGRRFGNATPGTGPTPSQLGYLTRLLAAADRTNERTAAECETIEMLIAEGHLTRKAASAAIDLFKTAPAATPARTNRYAGPCADCRQNVPAEAGSLTKEAGRWVTRHVGGCPTAPAEAAPVDGLDLRPLERFASRASARFGVPGSDTRLKVKVSFRRNGAIYVDDAAEYGSGRSYGRQPAGAAYRGDITEQLAAILADPMAALHRYAELTNSCGVCNLPLEDEVSVERGIGPVCWKRING